MKNLLLLFVLLIFSSSVYASCQGTGSAGNSTAGPSTPPPSCATSPPAGNTCLQATPICDLNGYCGSTASSYTDDYWCELGETFCGTSIENNSFLSFTASASTISFNIWVTGNSNGIQLMVFSAQNCSGPVTSHACYYPGSIQAGARTITATGLTPGNTYYIMIDGNGGAVCNYVIGANSGIATPVAVTPSTTTICAGESVNLTASGGDNTYTWPAAPGLPASTGATVSVTPPGPGTYTYTVNSNTSSSLCSGTSASATATVTVNPCGCSITAGNSGPICTGGTVDLTASTVTGGTGYSWTGPNGYTSSLQNPTGVVPPTAPGSYVYTVTTTLNGITCSSSTTVVVNSSSVNAGPDQTICAGEPVTLTATVTGSSTFTWSDPSVTNGVAFTPAATATYTVTGTCNATDQVTVTVNPLPTINAGNDALICEGASIVLAGSGGVSYSWDHGVTNGVPHTPTAATTYTVTGTDANGCQETDQVVITITPTPAVAFTPSITSGCTPLPVTFTNTDQNPTNNTYQWILGNGGSSTNPASASTVYTAPGCYDVTLISTTPNGCIGQSLMPMAVCVFDNPVAAFTPNPQVLSLMDVHSTMINESTGATDYIWNFGDGYTSTLFEPSHAFPSDVPGIYQISLIAISGQGCRDTARVNIEVEDVLVYYVPNSFTPDDDEHNPVFKPVFTSGFDPFDYKMLIFNRWGEMVFESHDAEYGWDGTYSASPGLVQDGTYTWKIEFKTTKTDERKMIIGSVTLIR